MKKFLLILMVFFSISFYECGCVKCENKISPPATIIITDTIMIPIIIPNTSDDSTYIPEQMENPTEKLEIAIIDNHVSK